MQEKIDKIKKIIAEADAVIITAGAGMGVDSGLPDFRGDVGFWRAYPLLRDKNLSFEDMANPQWFLDDPRLAWAFYGIQKHRASRVIWTNFRSCKKQKRQLLYLYLKCRWTLR